MAGKAAMGKLVLPLVAITKVSCNTREQPLCCAMPSQRLFHGKQNYRVMLQPSFKYSMHGCAQVKHCTRVMKKASKKGRYESEPSQTSFHILLGHRNLCTHELCAAYFG